MKMGTDFWRAHVLAAKQEAQSASELTINQPITIHYQKIDSAKLLITP